ncbi:hypothetical protein CDD82_5584 [Ophiocordyceps australis]|uniref:Uncharacterized protein n=1 Tax=Ophiocordyceps australis TaxID=1399860 RepID=A0A2C5ZT07_9HYPO|nr:hypothetical protein CDD82_5584 [Ophiocordyceps australis]
MFDSHVVSCFTLKGNKYGMTGDADCCLRNSKLGNGHFFSCRNDNNGRSKYVQGCAADADNDTGKWRRGHAYLGIVGGSRADTFGFRFE